MSVSYIHCQFSRVFPGSATLQRGFWSRAGARRSQERALVQDLRNVHLVYGQGFDNKEGICMSTLTVDDALYQRATEAAAAQSKTVDEFVSGVFDGDLPTLDLPRLLEPRITPSYHFVMRDNVPCLCSRFCCFELLPQIQSV